MQLKVRGVSDLAEMQVFDLSRPGREAQKLPRDTSNPTMLAKDRHLGGWVHAFL